MSFGTVNLVTFFRLEGGLKDSSTAALFLTQAETTMRGNSLDFSEKQSGLAQKKEAAQKEPADDSPIGAGTQLREGFWWREVKVCKVALWGQRFPAAGRKQEARLHYFET